MRVSSFESWRSPVSIETMFETFLCTLIVKEGEGGGGGVGGGNSKIEIAKDCFAKKEIIEDFPTCFYEDKSQPSKNLQTICIWHEENITPQTVRRCNFSQRVEVISPVENSTCLRDLLNFCVHSIRCNAWTTFDSLLVTVYVFRKWSLINCWTVMISSRKQFILLNKMELCS